MSRKGNCLDEDDAVITRTIIAMANNQGLNIFAEVAETQEQVSFLEQHSCYHIQG